MRPAFSDSVTFVAADDVLAGEFGNELIILNLRDGVYYSLEEVGARIWTLLREPVDLATLRDAVLADYEVEPARCERDLRALIAELVTRRLVDVRDGAG